MKPRAETRANTKEAQLERLIGVAQRAGLTIYGIAVGPRRLEVMTQPLHDSPPAEDAADRWLRRKLDEGQSGGRA